jgi:hypothetical protein
MILLHPGTRQYLSLNETGAFLWKLMENAATPTAMSEALCGRFDCTREEADEAVRELMQDLKEHKLVTFSDQGGRS